MEDGYIKFKAHWTKAEPFPWANLRVLDSWRARLHGVGLIGKYDNGIGFGNLSCRFEDEQFYITGSATGGYAQLGPAHYSLVTACDVSRNTLWCTGPIIASSESMSHAVVYRTVPSVRAVFHVHHRPLWEAVLHRIPTTPREVPYGTPEMARSIERLFQTTDVANFRLFAMAGHEEGLFSFGEHPAEAGDRLLRALDQFRN